MSRSEPGGIAAAVAQIEAAAAAGGLGAADLQRLLAALVPAFARRRREMGGALDPFAMADTPADRTDVAVTAVALLDAADMDVFELQMWKSLGRG